MSSLRERFQINNTGRIVDPKQAAKHKAELTAANPPEAGKDLDFSNLDNKLEEHFADENRTDLENLPRATVMKMLSNVKMGEHFIFQVRKGQGENYVQAMRQVLSRVRKKAYSQRIPLDEFKLLCHKIEQKGDHDEVVLVRVSTLTAHEDSVYNDIVNAIKKVMPENKLT